VTQQCPKCHSEIPVDPGYPVWCDRCEWNLFAFERVPPTSRREKLFLKVSDEVAQSQLAKISRTGLSAPGLTPGKLLAFAIATVVYTAVVAVAVFGIRLMLDNYRSNACLLAMGGLFAFLAFIMRPRIYPIPDRGFLSREKYPTLYKQADDLAAHLGTRPVDAIFTSIDFNASFFRAGWSRKNILHLGMPLFQILTPQERVALITHELAHSANGDVSRSFFISGAIRSLRTWNSFILAEGDHSDLIYFVPFAPVFIALLSLVAIIPAAMATALVLLLAGDSQRAEYLADNMAARAGGTEAMLGLLRKLHISRALMTGIDRFYENGGKQGVFDALRRKVDHVPPRELERVARVERRLDSRLDASHPPTSYRIQLLQARPVTHPEVLISPADSEALEHELSRIMPAVEAAMLHDYQDRTER
ncbi:MAG: M48 family metallopeptidase, partial [Chloroflexia bacterium]